MNALICLGKFFDSVSQLSVLFRSGDGSNGRFPPFEALASVR